MPTSPPNVLRSQVGKLGSPSKGRSGNRLHNVRGTACIPRNARFAGGFGYQDDGNGLLLLGHRFYDPAQGRFLTQDPIASGRNWWTYCDNDPLNYVDSIGLTPIPSEDQGFGGKLKGFTRHGLNQIIGRDGGVGVKNEAILDALKNGRIITQKNGNLKFLGKNATVVINPEGQMVTAWPKSRAGLRQPGSGSSLGVIMLLIDGADVLFQGSAQMIKYRRRLTHHIRAIDDDNDASYKDEGTSKGG